MDREGLELNHTPGCGSSETNTPRVGKPQVKAQLLGFVLLLSVVTRVIKYHSGPVMTAHLVITQAFPHTDSLSVMSQHHCTDIFMHICIRRAFAKAALSEVNSCPSSLQLRWHAVAEKICI